VARKWPRWIGGGLAFAFALAFAFLVAGERVPRPWAPAAEVDPLEQLRSLGYLTFSEEPAGPHTSGVRIHDRDRAFPGYNLYVSRTAPEALLLDMRGEVVHRWSYAPANASVWESAALLDDGDLLLIHKFVELLKLDWHSRPIWRTGLQVHHDLAVADDGSLYTIVVDKERFAGVDVYFDSLMHLRRDGLPLEKWSTRAHLDELGRVFDRTWFLEEVLVRRSRYERVHDRLRSVSRGLRGAPDHTYDHFHWNTVNLLPDTPLGRDDPRFRAGNFLVCFRNLNQIGVLEAGTLRPLWAWGEGILERPHHPTMLENGHILVFDNGVQSGRSRVIELDPASGRILWEYAADPPASFFSREKGSAQRLPNGNTLICEGDRGRVFEVTPAGEVVWEWRNPTLRDGHRAAIYRMQRLPPEKVEPLLRLSQTWKGN